MPEDQLPLTTTSFVVLGLVSKMEPVTSYDLKRRVATSIGYFWTFPHSQLYAEPARLAAAGLLAEESEPTGRRRRLYRTTAAGREALQRWLAEPTSANTEIRDLGLLKLFFSDASPRNQVVALAAEQHRAHEQRLAEYHELRLVVEGLTGPCELATLELGLRFEQMATDYWREITEHPPG